MVGTLIVISVLFAAVACGACWVWGYNSGVAETEVRWSEAVQCAEDRRRGD